MSKKTSDLGRQLNCLRGFFRYGRVVYVKVWTNDRFFVQIVKIYSYSK